MAFKSYSHNFTKSYHIVFEKIHFTSPPLWKILSANVTEKKEKNPINFDSIKNSFWVHQVSGIKILFPNFHKVIEWFLKKAHFTSPPLWNFTSPPIWKFLSPRVTTKPPKIHLILIQSKILFGYILALGCYSQNFTNSYRVVFENCSLYFISPLPYDTPKNLFNFDSI